MKNKTSILKSSKKIIGWIILIIIGMILICYGFAEVLVLDKLVIKDIIKIVAIFVFGASIFIIGLIYMQKRGLESILLDGDKKNYQKEKEPAIVVIGGGAGVNEILKGMKTYTHNITQIITIPTYGKRVKKLQTEDIKGSIIALSKNSTEMQKLMNYKRDGISFSDIYLSTIEDVYSNFAQGVKQTNQIFGITGKILPSTIDTVKICVELENGVVVEEKEKIFDEVSDSTLKINRVYLNPSNCKVTPGVIEAIQQANAIIIGPGSLYTNIIPNFLIRGVAKAIKESTAMKIYVSNIMTEPGNTDDYSVSEHIKAITEHAGRELIDYCICDNGDIIPEFLRKYNKAGSSLVEIDSQNLKGVKLVKADVSCIEGESIRHDPDLIAKTIIEIICDELKFKDKQNDEQYLLLNSKLKKEKEKHKKKKIKKVKPQGAHSERKQSKFSVKYKDRIKSIQESETTRQQNIKLHEKAKKITDAAEKKEKEKFLKKM